MGLNILNYNFNNKNDIKATAISELTGPESSQTSQITNNKQNSRGELSAPQMSELTELTDRRCRVKPIESHSGCRSELRGSFPFIRLI